jgi:hypothetical protein
MKCPATRRSDPDSLSERLGEIRRMMFLLASAENLKRLRESRPGGAKPDGMATGCDTAYQAIPSALTTD